MRELRLAAIAALSTSLAVAVAASGCGKGKSKDKGKAAAGGKAASAPHRGGHIVLESNEPRDLNPALSTRFDRATPLLFEGLVGLDANLTVVPRLAESWTVSADGKTITFTLRKGVRWHDDKPFTSADVAFTLEVIQKAKRATVRRAYMAGVEAIETPDEHTVVVKYATPYGPALSAWTVGIIPKHTFGGDVAKADAEDMTFATGTGPFMLQSWEPGTRIVLAANKNYWGGAPYVDSVEFLLNVPPSEQLKLLKEGKLDFVEITDVGEWSREVHTPEFRERFEVQDEVESRFRMLAWNQQRALFEDARVRVALTHALDRSRIIEDVLVGQGQLLTAPFFPTMYGADPTIAPYPFDLSKAVKLLDEANYPSKDGHRFQIELIVRESQRGPSEDAMLAIYRRNLQSIGVDLKVVYLDTRSFFDRIVLREFDCAMLGWLPDIADPDPYALLHSSQINAGPNYAGYSNAEVDRLLDEARAVTDRDARKALYHRVHAIVHGEEPYTMLYAPYGHYAWSRRLRGVNPRDIGTQPRFPGLERWWIAQVGVHAN